MVIAEQVARGLFAIHEKLADNTWRTLEYVEFPTPDGKGVFAPMDRLLWPTTSTPFDYGDESTLFNELIDFMSELVKSEKWGGSFATNTRTSRHTFQHCGLVFYDSTLAELDWGHIIQEKVAELQKPVGPETNA